MARKESIECEQLELTFKRCTWQDEAWQTKELDGGDKNGPWAKSEYQ
jgi:hypothetical protein